MYLICSTKSQLKFWRLAAYTHRLVAQETIHSHAIAENFFTKTTEQQWNASGTRWGNYFQPQGIPTRCSLSAHYPGDSRQQKHHQDTHVISQPDGDHGTKHFTRISWKKEEKLCKINCSPQYLKQWRFKANSWEYFKVTSTQYTNQHLALHRSYLRPFLLSSLAGPFWKAWPLSLLLCPHPLAPSGVQMSTTALRPSFPFMPSGPALPGTALVLPRSLVLFCLAPHWSAHALRSCPAWFRTGPPTPSGPVLPVSASVRSASGPVRLQWHSRSPPPLTTKSIFTPHDSVHSNTQLKKKVKKIIAAICTTAEHITFNCCFYI